MAGTGGNKLAGISNPANPHFTRISRRTWEPAVTHLMALAAAGVFVVGRYEDVWWESETALSIKERTLAPLVDKVKTAGLRPPPSSAARSTQREKAQDKGSDTLSRVPPRSTIGPAAVKASRLTAYRLRRPDHSRG